MGHLKKFYAICMIIYSTASFAQNWIGDFQLDGKVDSIESGTIILSYHYIANDKFDVHSDTTTIVDGTFHFQGTINEPVSGSLRINDAELPLFLEAAPMKIHFSPHNLEKYSLTGSLTDNESRFINYEFNRLGKPTNLLRDKIEALDSLSHERSILLQTLDSLNLQRQRTFVDFAKVNPRSFMILKYLSFFSPDWLSLQEVQSLYESYTPEQKEVPTAKLVAQMIEHKKESEIGKRAPDFELMNKKNVAIHLSDFQKKNYVLLDFGASWCGPCVSNTPYIKSCYNKYKNKGLIAIAISKDHSEKDWKKGIEKNGTADWYHIWDEAEQNNTIPLTKRYDISCYPTYILINKDGRIIRKWIGTITEDKDRKEFEAYLDKLSKEN